MDNSMIAVIVVLLVSSFLDALRDKWNLARYKRPKSHLPWPIIDKWHAVKRVGFYLPLVYILVLWQFPSVRPDPAAWWVISAVIVGGWIAWRLPEEPDHWS